MRDDLEGLISDPDAFYQAFYQKVDQRTKSVRSNVVKFVEKTRAAVEGIKDSRISEENKLKATAFLTSRAFSIRNRACGISEREDLLENLTQYELEINAYEYMYVAKFIAEERGEAFDEKKWLEEHDYSDIAKRHIPFSKEREEKIFTLAGIKQQCDDVRLTEVDESTKNTKQAVQTIGVQDRSTVNKDDVGR